MAEMVSKDQFGEFVKRMEQGFAHIGECFDQMERRFDQRFDQMDRHFDQIHADIRQMQGWLIGLYGIVVFGFIGSIFITLMRIALVSGTPTP